MTVSSRRYNADKEEKDKWWKLYWGDKDAGIASMSCAQIAKRVGVVQQTVTREIVRRKKEEGRLGEIPERGMVLRGIGYKCPSPFRGYRKDQS